MGQIRKKKTKRQRLSTNQGDEKIMVSNLAITGVIKAHAENQPNKTAIIIGDNKTSYKQLWEMINSAAEYFSGIGIKKGSHVLSVASPCLEYVVCMYALLGLGAVHVPAENRVPTERIVSIANSIDADLIICPENPDCGIAWTSLTTVDMQRKTDYCLDPVLISDDCSEIIFTTGTTGKSKGVMLSTHCLDTYIKAINPSFNLTNNSVFLVTTPLNHVGGLHRIHQCMFAGSAVILMDGIRDLRAFFNSIHTHEVTHTYLPPASVKLLITLAKKELAKLDGKLQFIYTASAPFPVADIEVLMSLLPNTRLHQGYGSSECGSVCNCCYNAPGESVACLGKPYPCVEVKLLDENGNQITEPNKEGSICIKSDMNMLGYYKEPELTASVLKDGFVHSSDLMYFDETGGLHFAGRGDDVINVRGFKVAPIEVEDVALKYDGILDCVCIPFDDAMGGRIIKMLVCVKDGATLDKEGLSAYLSEKLEAYKVPRIIEEVNEIARTANGKLNRKAVISEYSNIK